MLLKPKPGWNLWLLLCGLAFSGQLFGQPQEDFHWPQRGMAKVPAVGERIEAPSGAGQTQCMVNSAQFDPCTWATADGIVYTIAFRQRDGKDYFVTRVGTTDPKFKSPDGIRVGDAITVNGPEDVFEAPYFEVYANSKTQWVPIVGILGKANVVVSSKSTEMRFVQALWPNGPAAIRLFVSGFVEREPQKPQPEMSKPKITDLVLHQ
jgi:hypothetical protein